MKRKFTDYKPLLWILAIPILNVFYGVLNHGNTTVRSLMISWDHHIPFISAFIIPYVLWYPFIIAMLFAYFLKNKATYYRTLLTLCLGLIASYITFYFYQTTVERPIITETGPTYWLVNLIYMTDGPYNCFPSIHVLTSYLMLKGLSECNWSNLSKWTIMISSWIITFSTVFVKQHVLLDIVGAIVLVELLYFIVRKWIFSADISHSASSSRLRERAREMSSNG
ncbi:phosphatase PAP2 family protein [Paenibacillus fonticola]|uniref:phosphatase PAP2 family protein n=1 Tax=Paenibacillus fonticola TaxID=379896 RepID=UPI0003749574|nr:phosphatase PAP2 family protein [Paenibacillus fonticola]